MVTRTSPRLLPCFFSKPLNCTFDSESDTQLLRWQHALPDDWHVELWTPYTLVVTWWLSHHLVRRYEKPMRDYITGKENKNTWPMWGTMFCSTSRLHSPFRSENHSEGHGMRPFAVAYVGWIPLKLWMKWTSFCRFDFCNGKGVGNLVRLYPRLTMTMFFYRVDLSQIKCPITALGSTAWTWTRTLACAFGGLVVRWVSKRVKPRRVVPRSTQSMRAIRCLTLTPNITCWPISVGVLRWPSLTRFQDHLTCLGQIDFENFTNFGWFIT